MELPQATKYLGVVGVKGLFHLKITKIIDKDSYKVYNFITEDGRIGYTFVGKSYIKNFYNSVDTLWVGDCAVFSTVPQEHKVSEYNGKKETHFTKMVLQRYIGMTNA